MKAVILAGGKGTRLAPYTTIFPKPLLPLGEKPILEIIIKQLQVNGFDEIILAVGYLAELIYAYFGNGEKLGIKIRYSKEDSPLGTAGSLAMVSDLNDTFLFMNGDILSTIPFPKLIEYHKKGKNEVTIAVNKRSQKVDYGVIKVNEEGLVNDYIEKPSLDYTVGMGISIIEPSVLSYIPKGEYYDFPDLIKKMLAEKKRVAAYVSDDYWLDMGRHDDYEKAQQEFITIKDQIFKTK